MSVKGNNTMVRCINGTPTYNFTKGFYFDFKSQRKRWHEYMYRVIKMDLRIISQNYMTKGKGNVQRKINE